MDGKVRVNISRNTASDVIIRRQPELSPFSLVPLDSSVLELVLSGEKWCTLHTILSFLHNKIQSAVMLPEFFIHHCKILVETDSHPLPAITSSAIRLWEAMEQIR
jgi:hypothetical protein